jgi:steroid delta-isomerase-like uncharacterized protein
MILFKEAPTMSSKNVETMRAAHDSWNKRNFDATVSALTPNISYVDYARGVTLKTRDEFKKFTAGWAQAFPDAQIAQATYLDAGDTVVAQFTASGTNSGPFGSFPATGHRMTLPFCEICQFDAKGQVIGGGIYYDQFSLLTQLGQLRQAAMAAGS